MSHPTSLADRIVELEAKLALSDDALDALNRTVFRQQQAIEKLQAELRALQEIVEGSREEPGSLRDDIPPHY